MLAGLDKPLRRNGCSQDSSSTIGGGLSLQSLLQMSHDFTRSARAGEAMLVEAICMLCWQSPGET
jgi:hypothetical protein